MLVLHIGPHKTATTYLQMNLAKRRTALAAQGWDYPKVGALKTDGHHDLAHRPENYLSADGPHVAALADVARKNAGKGRSTIFSAEGFCRFPPPRLAELKDVFGVDEVHLVYAVRQPIDLFYSFWAEEVKQGHSISLPDRFAQHFASPMQSRLLNPLLDMRKLNKVDGVVWHFLPFEALKRDKTDIFTHLGDNVLGIPDLTPASSNSKNEAFPIELTEFLRLMTLIHGGGARLLEDRSALRLAFTSQTNVDERAEIAAMVKQKAALARRQIVFPAGGFFLRTLARKLATEFEGRWTRPVTDEDIYGSVAKKAYSYYDTFTLCQTSAVMDGAREMVVRLGFDVRA